MLAGTGADYYLRLERGKDHNPSPQVLRAGARVLFPAGRRPAAVSHEASTTACASSSFAGPARHAVLDTATRPDAEHLEAPAEAALGAPPSVSSPVRDGSTYTVAVDGRTIECSIRF